MKTISLLFVLLCSSSLFCMDKQEEAVLKQEAKQEETTSNQEAQEPRIIYYRCGNNIVMTRADSNPQTLALALQLAMAQRSNPFNPAKKAK